MRATDCMEQIVMSKYGVTSKSDCTSENLFFRQMAMAEVIDELESKIESLERKFLSLEYRS